MDFVFAIFPWVLTWRLKLQRDEKIALCITLSLGIVWVLSCLSHHVCEPLKLTPQCRIAVITAVRTWWKDTPLMDTHDEWYMCKCSLP